MTEPRGPRNGSQDGMRTRKDLQELLPDQPGLAHFPVFAAGHVGKGVVRGRQAVKPEQTGKIAGIRVLQRRRDRPGEWLDVVLEELFLPDVRIRVELAAAGIATEVRLLQVLVGEDVGRRADLQQVQAFLAVQVGVEEPGQEGRTLVAVLAVVRVQVLDAHHIDGFEGDGALPPEGIQREGDGHAHPFGFVIVRHPTEVVPELHPERVFIELRFPVEVDADLDGFRNQMSVPDEGRRFPLPVVQLGLQHETVRHQQGHGHRELTGMGRAVQSGSRQPLLELADDFIEGETALLAVDLHLDSG